MAPEVGHKDIDRGWAWWVLFASYLNLLLCSGLSYVAGMFQVVFLQEFHGSVALTSWVTSLFSSFMQLGGPMSSALANVVSCRAAVMVGGLCLSLGLALSALSDSLGVLFAFFGVIAGVGLGLTYTASVVIINYYFKERRTMVTGIALSSAGLGIMLGPQISTFLFQTFSWREALGTMSVASAQVCVLGALMFPMHEKQSAPICSRVGSALKTCLSRQALSPLLGTCRGGNKGREEPKDSDIGATTRLVGGGGDAEGKIENCLNGGNTILAEDSDLKYSDGRMNGVHRNGLKPKIQGDSAVNSQNMAAVDDKQDKHGNCYKQLFQSASELSPYSVTVVESPNRAKAIPNEHLKHRQVEDLALVNNSTSSLRDGTSNSSKYHHHPYHHYVLKHLHHGGPVQNLHSARAQPKSHSHFELSVAAHSDSGSHDQLPSINGIFRSNRELHSSKHIGNQTDMQGRIRRLLSPNGTNTSDKQVLSASSKTPVASSISAHNFDTSDCQRSETSSLVVGSCEKFGHPNNTRRRSSSRAGSTTAPDGSTSHLHVTVVPHNPSLLSLVASTQQLDLIVHRDDQPSSKEYLLDNQHPLHKGLFGIDHGASDLGLSRSSLKSSPSRCSVPPALVTSQSKLEGGTKLASSAVSLSQAHNHVSGKDPNRALYRNNAFLLLCVQLFVANCACGVFNIHMPSFTMSKGVTGQEMTNILSINGLALLSGRMLIGALASATGLDLLIYWALHMIGGLFIIILPVAATGYFNFCFLIYGIGTFFGSVYSILTSLTLKYVGLSRLATAFGVEMVCAGLGYLLAPPVAGLLVDMTGSYDYNMYFGGALLILSSFIVMLLPILEPEVTREDLRRFLEGHPSPGGVDVDVEIEDCPEGLEDGRHDDVGLDGDPKEDRLNVDKDDNPSKSLCHADDMCDKSSKLKDEENIC